MSIKQLICKLYKKKEVSALDLIAGAIITTIGIFGSVAVLYIIGGFGRDKFVGDYPFFDMVLSGIIRVIIAFIILIALVVLESWKVVKCDKGD